MVAVATDMPNRIYVLDVGYLRSVLMRSAYEKIAQGLREAIDSAKTGTAVPDTCADCRQPIGPTTCRLWIGDRVYHADTCGPGKDK